MMKSTNALTAWTHDNYLNPPDIPSEREYTHSEIAEFISADSDFAETLACLDMETFNQIGNLFKAYVATFSIDKKNENLLMAARKLFEALEKRITDDMANAETDQWS